MYTHSCCFRLNWRSLLFLRKSLVTRLKECKKPKVRCSHYMRSTYVYWSSFNNRQLVQQFRAQFEWQLDHDHSFFHCSILFSAHHALDAVFLTTAKRKVLIWASLVGTLPVSQATDQRQGEVCPLISTRRETEWLPWTRN